MDNKTYDLEERTAQFGEQIIDFVKTLSPNLVNQQLIRQIVRSGTSIGANYMEADAAESKKDFRHKIAILQERVKRDKTLAQNNFEGKPWQGKRMQEIVE